jgi:hypothetical protein
VIIEGNAALSIHDHSEEEEESRCTFADDALRRMQMRSRRVEFTDLTSV